jgi:hypothetical protein
VSAVTAPAQPSCCPLHLEEAHGRLKKAHTSVVAGGEMGHAAPDLQRGAIAVLDPDGNVTWADESVGNRR